jgi:hypothetical protein
MNARDVNGQSVAVGDQVKIISVRDSVLDRLDPVESARVASMKGAVLSVYEIDEWGGAWVRLEWETGEGRSMSHSISLASTEMERV